jgi:glycogen phosphorylase
VSANALGILDLEVGLHADLKSYVKTQEDSAAVYRQPEAWARPAIINVGHSGKFSSDRTIMEYARGIWTAEACPVA